jgi:hypothetical protein
MGASAVRMAQVLLVFTASLSIFGVILGPAVLPSAVFPSAEYSVAISPSVVAARELELTPVQKLQIRNYKEGNGLILNFHITHHGGTTACHWAGENGPVPSAACTSGNNVPKHLGNFARVTNIPWSYNQTDFLVGELRKYFHFVAWEFNWSILRSSLAVTNFEHPNMLSIIIMRNPLTRFMSDVDRRVEVKNRTAEEWWDYANNSNLTNNYALRSLTGHHGCCQGEKTSSKYVDMAKTFLKRFTFIIDLECLTDSLRSLSETLNLNMTKQSHANRHSKSKSDLRGRLKNDTLYMHLVKRNARDIELYEWAQTQALVQCRQSGLILNLTGLDIHL